MKDKANDVLPASNGELQTDHEMPFHEIYNRCPLYVIKEIAFHIIKLRLKFKKENFAMKTTIDDKVPLLAY